MSSYRTSEPPELGILILNWNGAALLREFLPGVIRNTDPQEAEVVVIDNGSTDDSVRLLQQEFPGVRLLALGENLGYAGGYNRALRELHYPYVCLLNSDVAVRHPGWYRAAVLLLCSNPGTAVVQPKILSYKSPDTFEYAGAAGGFIDRLGYPFCRGRIMQTVEQDRGQYDSQVPLHWAGGAAFFVRREAFLQVGGLDTAFFAHMEEIDLCWRLRNRGYRILFTPDSCVYHLGGGTLQEGNPQKTYLNFRNNRLMLRRNLTPAQNRRVQPWRSMLDLLAAAHFLLQGKAAHARAVCRALRDYRRMKRAYAPQEATAQPQNTSAPSPLPPRAPFCLLWQYYGRRRRTFQALPPFLP